MNLNNINSILCKGNDLMGDSLSILSLNHQHLMFVIDGLSSCSQPQKATNLCRKILENKFYNQEILDANELKESLYKVHNELLKLKEDLRCCISGVFISYDQIIVFNVGDCRVYGFTNNKITRITKDDTIVQELIDKNIINNIEALMHHDAGIITQSLGSLKKIDIHLQLCETIYDSFLIVTDGLSGMFSDEHLLKIYIANKDKGFLEKLSEMAVLNHQPDDQAGILIRN
jgi:serine/threonine protein phosphatase PrpC